MLGKIFKKNPAELLYIAKLIIIVNVSLVMILLVKDTLNSVLDFMLVVITIFSMLIFLLKNNMESIKKCRNLLMEACFFYILTLLTLLYFNFVEKDINTAIVLFELVIETFILATLFHFYIKAKNKTFKEIVNLNVTESDFDLK